MKFSHKLLRGGSRVWKEGGGILLKKVEEQKKKRSTIIASDLLPNILYHVCYVKQNPIYNFMGKLHCLMNIVATLQLGVNTCSPL